MWQLEDLFRAFQFKMELIEEKIIQPMQVSDNQKYKQIYEWYESLIEMMRLENVTEKGHLQINKNIIIELNDFHEDLMKSGKMPGYNGKFIHVLPLIHQFRQKSDSGLNDIELCFNFQYGFLMLKMKHSEISAETFQTQQEISKLMVLLAKNYHDHQNGLLDLE
jgi:hypothetical protein